MKPGAGAVRMLVCSAAHAGDADWASDRDCTGDQTPEITINAQYDKWSYQYQTPYGEDLIINCSGEGVNLKIEENGNQLQTIEVNVTTVQVRVKKPAIGSYTYSCIDRHTSCRHSLTVTVHPAMYVESAKVQHKLNQWGDTEYFVPLSYEYKVFCRGHDAASLSIEDEYYELLQTDAVNSTTIVYKKHADRVGDTVYNCQSKGTTVPVAGMYERILVTVEPALNII